jgi:hypothetical protein
LQRKKLFTIDALHNLKSNLADKIFKESIMELIIAGILVASAAAAAAKATMPVLKPVPVKK